jgi:hypothetical protein
MANAAFCLATDEVHARSIVAKLKSVGFGDDDISVLMQDGAAARSFGIEQHTKAPEGTTVGVGAGGVLGGAVGVLAGLGALAIPGIGPLVAAGPLLAGLSGMAAGATVGGIVGSLVGFGMPEFEAKVYEGKLKTGHVLVSAHADTKERLAKATAAFADLGGMNVTSADAKPVPKLTPPSNWLGSSPQ